MVEEAFKVFNLMVAGNKEKRLIKKMQLLAVLIHSPPQGDLEGLRRLDRPPRRCLGLNQCAFVRKRGTGQKNVLSALLWDVEGQP